jgi:ribosome-binding protein aMBF1 (putative translation factor)
MTSIVDPDQTDAGVSVQDICENGKAQSEFEQKAKEYSHKVSIRSFIHPARRAKFRWLDGEISAQEFCEIYESVMIELEEQKEKDEKETLFIESLVLKSETSAKKREQEVAAQKFETTAPKADYSFATTIQQARIAKGWKQTEVAQKMKIPVNEYKLFEITGGTLPTKTKRQNLMRILGIKST